MLLGQKEVHPFEFFENNLLLSPIQQMVKIQGFRFALLLFMLFPLVLFMLPNAIALSNSRGQNLTKNNNPLLYGKTHSQQPTGVVRKLMGGGGVKNSPQQQKSPYMSMAQKEILGRIQQQANAAGGGSITGGTAGGMPGAGTAPPWNQKVVLPSPGLDRIQALSDQVKTGQILPGQLLAQREQLLAQQGKLHHHGKMMAGQVASDVVVDPTAGGQHQHHGHHQHHNHHQHHQHETEKIVAAAAVVVEKIHGALEHKEKELKKMELKALHHKQHQQQNREMHKANRAQRGFMAIVVHTITRPKAEETEREASKATELRESKHVHNLLWTAVALARERLAVQKTKAPVCLLEFLGHMVGGAFAPFTVEENRDDSNLVREFLKKLRRYEVAFLSSGYRPFWKKELKNKKKKFEKLEEEVHPVFLNHEE